MELYKNVGCEVQVFMLNLFGFWNVFDTKYMYFILFVKVQWKENFVYTDGSSGFW